MTNDASLERDVMRMTYSLKPDKWFYGREISLLKQTLEIRKNSFGHFKHLIDNEVFRFLIYNQMNL